MTYQGLHAACNNLKDNEESDDEEETNENRLEESTNPNLINIIKGLREQNVKTIVVDEAHHLKNEWWQTLTKIKEQIECPWVGDLIEAIHDHRFEEAIHGVLLLKERGGICD